MFRKILAVLALLPVCVIALCFVAFLVAKPFLLLIIGGVVMIPLIGWLTQWALKVLTNE